MTEQEHIFVVTLAVDPRCTDSDKARILRLTKSTKINHQLILEKVTKSEHSAEDSKTNRESDRHLPLELIDFLKQFSAIGSPLKYTTHPWDDNNNFESFDAFVEQYSFQLTNHPYWRYGGGDGEKSKIATCNSKLYRIIRYYLQKKEIDEYTWGKDKIKVGLLSKGAISSWLQKNPGHSFLDMPVSEFNEKSIFCEGARIFEFSDVVDQFKNAIEFRNNTLFNTIRRATLSPDVSVDIDKLESLKGVSFYTDTSLIIEAFQKIILNCKGRAEKTDFEIWADEQISEGNKYIDIHILHKDSFSDKNIDDPKLKLESGNLLDIKNLLIGLCDFFVESRFMIDNKPSHARIEYLTYKDRSGTMRTVTKIEESHGFEYILRFYLPQFN